MNPVQSVASQSVKETLGRSSDVDSCVALTRLINELLSQATQSFTADDQRIACREGCSFCCHLRVLVYPHEAIGLYRYLRSQMPKDRCDAISKQIAANAKLIAAYDREGKLPPNLPCAFLVEGRCSAYDARPNTCSGYHSLSRERCERAFEARATAQTSGAMDATNHSDSVPMLQGLRFVAGALDEGLDAGLAEAGLSNARLELHTALNALLRNPSLIERWRSGRELRVGPTR
jgi:hypothetical protein